MDKLKKFVKKNKSDQYANFLLDSLTIFFTGNPKAKYSDPENQQYFERIDVL